MPSVIGDIIFDLTKAFNDVNQTMKYTLTSKETPPIRVEIESKASLFTAACRQGLLVNRIENNALTSFICQSQ